MLVVSKLLRSIAPSLYLKVYCLRDVDTDTDPGGDQGHLHQCGDGATPRESEPEI